LVARDAGLGELGRMGLLMTPKLGPRVRISVVTTDIPLLIDNRNAEYSVTDFCRMCKKCAVACPSKAISFEDKNEIDGVKRWQINSEACFSLWCTMGTDCGRCIAVCPYSHHDNLFHNFIRLGIKNSKVFRKFAVEMDDAIYGRKPATANLPDWLQIYTNDE
jgi:epoxyqueuosine reductase QueG